MQRCFAVVVFSLLLTAGCVALSPNTDRPAIGSCSLELPPTSTDREAIRAVLTAEGELVVEQKIDTLMNLWGEGATIVDAKHTPMEATDDQAWLDKDAIRHRYVRTVFPGAPKQADPKDLQIQLIADGAVVTATTQIGAEISPAGDRWVLVRQTDCWLIQNLTYNLEPK